MVQPPKPSQANTEESSQDFHEQKLRLDRAHIQYDVQREAQDIARAEQARLDSDAVRKANQEASRKAHLLETRQTQFKDNYGFSKVSDKSIEHIASFDRRKKDPQPAEFYRLRCREIEDFGYF